MYLYAVYVPVRASFLSCLLRVVSGRRSHRKTGGIIHDSGSDTKTNRRKTATYRPSTERGEYFRFIKLLMRIKVILYGKLATKLSAQQTVRVSRLTLSDFLLQQHVRSFLTTRNKKMLKLVFARHVTRHNFPRDKYQ